MRILVMVSGQYFSTPSTRQHTRWWTSHSFHVLRLVLVLPLIASVLSDLLKARVALPNGQQLQLLAHWKDHLSHRSTVSSPRHSKFLLEAIVVVRVAILDARVRRVVSPVGYLELFEAAKKLRTRLGHHLPRPRLFGRPHKVLDSGDVEARQRGQVRFYPAEVVYAGPVGHGYFVHVVAVRIRDTLLEIDPANDAHVSVLPVAQPQVSHVVQLYGVPVERLIDRDAVLHALAQALQGPGGAAVEVVHDALEDIIGQLQQGALGVGGRGFGLGHVEGVVGDGAAVAAAVRVLQRGRRGRHVEQVKQVGRMQEAHGAGGVGDGQRAQAEVWEREGCGAASL
jgi:hypothetical protein